MRLLPAEKLFGGRRFFGSHRFWIVQSECARALQGVDDDGLSGMVGRGVFGALESDGAVLSIVVRAIALMSDAMFFGELFPAELLINQREVVVRGHVLGINLESSKVLIGGLREKLFLHLFIAAFAL